MLWEVDGSTLGQRAQASQSESLTARLAGWELTFPIALGALLLLLTSLPYVFGYLSSPPDRQFMGLTYTTHDYAQYMSWARESAGGLFAENKLTPEQSPPSFFNLYWWAFGRAQHQLGLSFVQLNHVSRLVWGGLFVAVAYWFCSVILADRNRRRFALALTCLASGFGWLLIVAKQFSGELASPMLVYTSPGNTFFSVMVLPHHAFAAAIHVALLVLVLQGYPRGCLRRAGLAGLLGLLLGLVHAYDLVSAWAVVATFAILTILRDGARGRRVLWLAAFFGLSAPAPLYWLYLTATSPEWQQVLAQFRNLGVFTPDPLQLVVLLGATLILAALTFRGFVPLAERRDDELFLAGWFVVNLLIIYLPVNFQVMMLNGFQVALAVLATRGLFDHVLPWLRPRAAAVQGRSFGIRWLEPRLSIVVPALFLALVVPTNVYLLSWRFVDLGRHQYPDYLHRDDVAALHWLAERAAPDDVVLSSMVVGHYVPGWTGAHAFLAHGAGTLQFYEKRSMVERFFAAATPEDERQETLRRFRVSYVFHGPAERSLGQFQPDGVAYLEPSYVAPSTTVYRVHTGGRSAQGGPPVEGR